MIKNIIFDLGGVIITIDQKEAVRRFQEIGLKNAEEALNPYTQSGVLGDLEVGKISPEVFQKEMSQVVGRTLSYDECKYAWMGYVKELPQRNLEALKKLRKEGYRLILLSNTNPFIQSWSDTEFGEKGASIKDYFDGVYRSFEVKLMKPDERFFQKVIASENISPEESLFVDDGQRNVSVASTLGIHTYCPENGSDWTNKIYDYLK